jgi:serine/threonine-protein kinase HipA
MHCGLERRLVAREMTRMTKSLRKVLPELQSWPGYDEGESSLIERIAQFTLDQADRLEADAKLLPEVILD